MSSEAAAKLKNVSSEIPDNLNKDAYSVKFGENFSYDRVALVANREIICNYKGVLHEYLNIFKPNYTHDRIEGDYHFESRRLGSRSKNPNKYIDDGNILANAFHKEIGLFAITRKTPCCHARIKSV